MTDRSPPSLPLRFTFLAAIATWIGGLTFYGGIVVPVATGVLGSHRDTGFITRAVTLWMNGIGAVALVIVFAHMARLHSISRAARTSAWLMVALQAALFALHPVLDAHLDPASNGVDEPDSFYVWHRAYLLTSLSIWVAGVVHVAAVLRSWRDGDRIGAA